jgi:hypothetical protein
MILDLTLYPDVGDGVFDFFRGLAWQAYMVENKITAIDYMEVHWKCKFVNMKTPILKGSLSFKSDSDMVTFLLTRPWNNTP